MDGPRDRDTADGRRPAPGQRGAPHGRLPRRRLPRRQMWARRAVVGATVLVSAAIVVVGGAFAYLRYRYGQIHLTSINGLASGSGPIDILLAGDNCRACLNGKQANAFGTGADVGGGRSDVTMVLHLDPATHQASLLSIPRDTFLPIPGSTRANRVDDALNSGPQELVKTIEQDLGIPINHYVSVNFDTFQDVVNSLGGISMYFPDPVKDAYSALNIPTAGCHHLDGFQALAVVRARHLYYYQDGRWNYDGSGDLSRIKRDHAFLQVLAASVEHRGLSNPLTLNAVVGNVAPKLQLDSAMSLRTLVGLVKQYRSTNPASVPTLTLPVVVDPNTYYYQGANYGSVVFPDYPADQQTIDQFLGRKPAAPRPASGVTVQVFNGSGIADQATTTASGLSSQGYSVVGTGESASGGHPSETTIYYRPGHLDDAVALARRLSGLVAIGPAPTGSGHGAGTAAGGTRLDFGASTLTVVTGSDLTVAAPPTGGGRGSAGGTTSSPPAPSGSASGSALGPPTPAQTRLQNFDPTACPAGSPVH